MYRIIEIEILNLFIRLMFVSRVFLFSVLDVIFNFKILKIKEVLVDIIRN